MISGAFSFAMTTNSVRCQLVAAERMARGKYLQAAQKMRENNVVYGLRA
jgi:hypothetical protein